MPDDQLFLQAIEAIYASGLERELLPTALEATSRLLGGVGATLEVIDKPAQRHAEFWLVGVPPDDGDGYVEHFAALSPRIPLGLRQRAGDVAWDYQIFDEAGLARDPFYAEFLPRLGLRYFVSAVLAQTPEEFAVVAVHRTPRQGHVGRREIAVMQRLAPHFQRAHDVAKRLKAAHGRQGMLENALDWLTDGVALLRTDGHVVYANDALRALARRGDGLRITKGAIEFVTADARRRFGAAFDAVRRGRDSSIDSHPTDFPVLRRGGIPAYIVSVRPLIPGQARGLQNTDAAVMLFVRDPLDNNVAVSQMLRELFSLTDAEAHLAQALCTGMATDTYASKRHVSLNTVYTHLRRLREKTGCKSVADLTRKFSELNLPLRLR
jgi:DNA-binding CsgD family transcriptional regulator/PAS domain-containing protein